MKISVFGATGFIGSNFCEMYPEMTIAIPRGENFGLSDNMLYLISTTSNYESWRENIDTNIIALYERLKWMHTGATLNFASSWFVFGDVPLPATEMMQPNPKGGNYNLTKLWAEQLVREYCSENEIPYRIFRLANVFGKGDKFSEKKNALQYLINEMKHDRDIHLYDNGRFFRDYIHVDDACRMLYNGMKILPVNEIFNVGSGRPILFRDMILLAHTNKNRDSNGKAVLGSKSKIYDKEPSDFHKRIQVRDFWLDTTKINSHGILNRSSPFEKLVRMLQDDA